MIRLSSACAMLLLFASTAGAAGFARIGIPEFTGDGIFSDARRTGMGNADLVGGGGPQQVLVNPAYLVTGGEATATYDRMNYLANIDLETIAVAAAVGHLQVAAARHEMRWERQPTAYNPTSTTEFRERMTVIGVAGRGGALLRGEDGFRWALGLGYRHYEILDGGDADGLDAGVSGGWRQSHDGGWNSLDGAVSWQNIHDAKVSIGDREVHAPDPVRIGITGAFGLHREGGTRDTVTFRGAFTRFVSPDGVDDVSQWGAELTIFQVVAVRTGTNGRLYSQPTQWGLGLILDEEFTGPFRAEAHWAQIRFGENTWGTEPPRSEGWGARLTYEF